MKFRNVTGILVRIFFYILLRKLVGFCSNEVERWFLCGVILGKEIQIIFVSNGINNS